jgi:hypothetical protein
MIFGRELTRAEKRDRAIAAVRKAIAECAEVMDGRTLAAHLEASAGALKLKWATTAAAL